MRDKRLEELERRCKSEEAIELDKRLRILSEAMRASCNDCRRGMLCSQHVDEWWGACDGDGLAKAERKYSALGENET